MLRFELIFLTTNIVIYLIERVDSIDDAENDGDDDDDGNKHNDDTMNSDNGAKYFGGRDEIDAIGFDFFGGFFDVIYDIFGAVLDNKLATTGFADSVALAGFKLQICATIRTFFLDDFHEYMIA